MMKILVSFLFGLMSLIVRGQSSVIIGEATDYPLWNVYVFEEEDLFTSRRNLLASTSTDGKGQFRLELAMRETGQVILSIGDQEAILYVEPAHKYSVAFPRSGTGTTTRTFDKTSVELQLSVSDPHELNTLIRSFNADLATFVDEHFFDFAADQYRGSEAYTATQKRSGKNVDMFRRASENPDSTLKKTTEQSFGNAVNTFQTEIEKKYKSGFSNLYFAEYVRYSLADVYMWAGSSRRNLYETYFLSEPLHWRNPAWVSFVQLYWNGSYDRLQKSTRAEILRTINAESSWRASLQKLQNDSLCTHDVLRSVVLLDMLEEGLFNNTFSRIAVLKTLDKAATEEADSNVRRLALNLKYQLQRCKNGWELDDFTLLDRNKNKWSLQEQRGRYIYFFFFANWCTACKKELMYLQSLQEKYEKSVQIVAINMDTEYSEFEAFLRENPTYRFEFLSGAADPLLRQKMNIRALPHALLIDPNGMVVGDYTRRPSEGLNLEFDKLQKILSPANGGRSWRD
jgi:peroxiredoxin